jgi:hypothetical protein
MDVTVIATRFSRPGFPSWQKKIALLLRASRNSAMVMVDQEVNRQLKVDFASELNFTRIVCGSDLPISGAVNIG